MNSSSKKAKKEYNHLSEAAAEGGEGEKSGNLLELTLGFGSVSSKAMHGLSSLLASEPSSSSSFPSQPTKQSQELALGLKLGFETKNHPEPSENYRGLLWGHHHHFSNSLPFPSPFSSSSSSLMSSTMLLASTSLPSSDFAPVHGLSWPVPNVSHHCSERPRPGLWFSLRSIINRDGEILPQIPKAYIRVKNENVTVFMVKTYLVRKLGLSNEARVCNNSSTTSTSPGRQHPWFPIIDTISAYESMTNESFCTTVITMMRTTAKFHSNAFFYSWIMYKKH